MIGGEQGIKVGDGCGAGVLTQELGHTAGFFHEQSRADRNRHVTVLYENINKKFYGDFRIAIAEQDIGPYDYASHMHYGPDAFISDGLPGIQTVPAGIPLDSYQVLSPGDLNALARIYGQPTTKTTIVTNPPNLQFVIDGKTVTSPQTLTWDPGSTHTVNVADQTGQTSRYRFAGWTDGGTAAHTITTDPAVTFYSADFVQQVQVSAGVGATGGGAVSLSAP